MAYYKRLVIFFLAFFSIAGHAGYANVKGPLRSWQLLDAQTNVPSVALNKKRYEFDKLQAEKFQPRGDLLVTKGEIAVAGRADVVTDIAFRMKEPAIAVVAAALSSNPYIVAGTILAPMLYDIYQRNKLIPPSEDLPDDSEWGELSESVNEQWRYTEGAPWVNSPQAACASETSGGFSRNYCPSNGFCMGHSSEPGGGPACSGSIYVQPEKRTLTGGSVKTVTPEYVENKLKSDTFPPILPLYWPDPLPLEPVINPSETGTTSRALRVPVGEPQLIPAPEPNPENIPNRTRQPVVDITPAPSPDGAPRVDITPKDIIKDGDTPTPIPDGGESQSDPTDKEVAKDPGLCDQYPDILACAKPVFDVPEPVPFPNEDRPLSIVPDAGWGPSSAACPAPKTANIMGVQLVMPFTLICDVAAMINPLLIGFAWLSAAFTFFGIGRRD